MNSPREELASVQEPRAACDPDSGIDQATFHAILAKHAGTEGVDSSDVLFGEGLDLSSIAFLEFIVELEEVLNLDIDADRLDASIETVGQLFARIFAEVGPAGP